jgi:predicted oxidoreductase
MNSSSVIKAPIAGCMRWGKWGAGFSTKEYRQLIDACLENGIRSFDHADIYGDYTTEAEFGEALKEMPSLRSELRIISKCGIQMVTPNRSAHEIKSYNTSAAHIISSVDQSLRNFGTDHLDLLLIHVEAINWCITELIFPRQLITSVHKYFFYILPIPTQTR